MATIKKAQNGVSKSSKPAPKPTAKPAVTPKPKPKTVSQKIGDITLRDIKNAGEDALNLSTLGMYRPAKKKIKEAIGMKNGGAAKMKMGGSLKKVPAGKVGLAKLPTPVRNKMGYQKNGGVTKAKCGTSMSKKKK